MDLQNRPRKHASADGWSIATALGLLAVAFVWDRMAPAQPKEGGGLEPKEDQSRHASPASLVTEGGDRIWSLLNLELWHRTFIDQEGIQTLPHAHSVAEIGSAAAA